ncbi:MAG: signal peptidase II [Spirochaetes bacterium]|nr:signal peptidase II [Spirochaetota bacterium]
MRSLAAVIKSKWIFFGLSVIYFVLDVVSKILVVKYLPIGVTKAVLSPFLLFIHIKNPGIAYGMFKNPPAGLKTFFFVLIILVMIAASIFLVYLIATSHVKLRASLISFSLILGGALGNLADRIVDREVTDFISIGLTNTLRFNYIFNLADMWITFGFSLLIIATFILKEDAATKETQRVS